MVEKNAYRIGNLKEKEGGFERQLTSLQGLTFVFAQMKCCYAAFGEQNKTENDSKCQHIYKP